MQSKHVVIVLGSVVLLLASCGQNSQRLTSKKTAAIKSEVRAVHNQMVEAAKELDTEKMFGYILDSQETVIQSGDRYQTRPQAMASISEGFKGLSSLQYQFEQIQVTVLSTTTAEMATSGYSIATTVRDKTSKRPFRQTLRFRLTNDGWKMVYAHHMTEEAL